VSEPGVAAITVMVIVVVAVVISIFGVGLLDRLDAGVLGRVTAPGTDGKHETADKSVYAHLLLLLLEGPHDPPG
jgi:hypothetical protein